ncbi:MAG: deoxyribonuclease IV [Spirochaetales bacterium]|nr:deoxyribonuclease IV [Candidatus Physcosoma equi]
MLYIGPHVSISESIALSVERAHALGATGFALFTKNQRQWKSSPLKEEEIALFQKNLTALGYSPKALLPHAGYLINPATPDPELRAKSEALFLEEVKRLVQLGIDVINIHPGAYKEGSVEEGIQRTSAMLDTVLEANPDFRIAVENTAGAGTILGSSFQELSSILDHVHHQERVGFTLDTAHLFGAGYDVKGDPDKVLDEFFSYFPPEKLYGMHLNDSKVPLASNKDRHDNIGLGLIGKEAFLEIVKRPEVQEKPLILETPDESLWSEEIKELLDAGQR